MGGFKATPGPLLLGALCAAAVTWPVVPYESKRCSSAYVHATTLPFRASAFLLGVADVSWLRRHLAPIVLLSAPKGEPALVRSLKQGTSFSPLRAALCSKTGPPSAEDPS